MSKGYVYILKCADGSYYTGSTNDIEARFYQHQQGEGANYTKKRRPVKLVFLEEFDRIDDAFFLEKQIQGWRREKKEALIKRNYDRLPFLASRTSATERKKQPLTEVLEVQGCSSKREHNVSHRKEKG
ncbi:MAG: GIY-YIG nuclease family protein [Alphaproteobacteria bacterium]|nr:GIY-YIG nuclease family protein [Alphaproteobacteria bacterium]MBN2780111.1 GIY-YIG nuclease family protein [Alphaproteobacteria bacterium]